MAHENDWIADQHENEPKSWSSKTWSGFVPTYGSHIWSIGDEIYYSNGNSSNQYVLNKTNLTWEPKTWSGLNYIYGYKIWTDGDDYFYSNAEDGEQYVLDQNTSRWNYMMWSGFAPLDGAYVWTDGENTYYSQGSSQYVFDKAATTWSAKTWSGLTSFDGNCVWTDGESIYYSKGSAQYVLDKATSTWSEKTWNGMTSFDGSEIWHCGDYIFYSVGNVLRFIQYSLDRTTSTWYAKSWNNSGYLNGRLIWTDGEKNIYSSNGQNDQRILNREIVSSVPYRSNFPEMIESADLHDKWITELDPDAPASVIEFDPNYRYVKLEFNVNITADNDNSPYLQATTDLPNSAITISSGYYWYQWNIQIEPATSVASRLYAAEESATNISDFMAHVDTYGSTVETRGYQGINLAMSPKKEQYSSDGDFDITGSIYSSVTNTSQYNAQRTDNYYRSHLGYSVYLNQTATGSSSSTVTVKLYYCFDQDESGYDALLAEYPNHASPYNPAPATKVPYRLDFPPLIESINLDSWLIDDDIPFRINFPKLKESVNPYDKWLIDDDIPFRWNFPKLIESSANPVQPPSYFTFKGRSSAEFGSIEILPLCLKHEEKTDFINFIFGNPYVSETTILRSKVITITLNLSDISPANIDRVNAWLIGTGKLVLSHDPHRYYIATCNNALTGQKLVNTLGKVAVQFNVMPYKYDLKEKDSFEPVDLVEEALHKTAAIYYKGSAPAESTFKITATGNIEIYNVQTEKTIEIKGLTEYCIIDIKARKVTDESNLNILNRTYGDIFDLMLVPGYNYFFLSGSVTAVEVKKKTRWY